MDAGIKGIQHLRHLMKQLGLPGIDCPTPVLNDNRGSVDWIDSGCKPTKKLRHENLAELGVAEAEEHGEVSFCWIPGKTNPSDVFTKEDNDVAHCCGLRDLMVKSREDFTEENQTSTEEHPMQKAPEVAAIVMDADKENKNPVTFACADIVKRGPDCQRPPPLVMGGAKSHPDVVDAASLESEI